jgi:hypothetical protein
MGLNSGITFPTAVTRYWVATSGGHWNVTTSWSDSSGGGSGASVPLPHDTVVFDANSITSAGRSITLSKGFAVPSLDFSNVLNSPSVVSDNSNIINGNLNTTGITTIGHSLNFYCDSNISVNPINANCHLYFKVVNGTATFTGAYDGGISRNISMAYATVDFNDNNITFGNISSSNTGTSTVYFGNGTITARGTYNIILLDNSTVYAENSTILVTDATALWKNIAVTNPLNILTISSDNVTFLHGTTIAELNLNTAGLKTGTIFTKSTTSNIANFSTNGSSGSLAKIRSSSTTNATLNYTGEGVVEEDYIDIDYITGTPDNTWYVGTNSTDGGHNSQIYFTDAPTVVSESESITVTDSPTLEIPVIPIEVNESDTVTITSTPTVLIADPLSISTYDSVSVSDNSTVSVQAVTPASIYKTDSITVTDSPTLEIPVIPLEVNKSETITLTESPVLLLSTPVIEASESITLDDSPTVTLPNALIISKLEGVAITDAPTVSVQELVALEIIEADVVTVTDTPNMENQLSGVESYETITVIDSPTVYTFQENLEIDTNEFVFTFESIDSNATIDLLTNDTIVVTDSVEVENCYSVEGAETVTITTVPSFRFGKGRKRVISNISKNLPTFKVNPNKPRMEVRRYKR